MIYCAATATISKFLLIQILTLSLALMSLVPMTQTASLSNGTRSYDRNGTFQRQTIITASYLFFCGGWFGFACCFRYKIRLTNK